jgi:hypothetical protein
MGKSKFFALSATAAARSEPQDSRMTDPQLQTVAVALAASTARISPMWRVQSTTAFSAAPLKWA